MYVDESGDVGTVNSPTKYFILSAIVIHELRWKTILTDLVEFRKYLRDEKNLKLRDEIHCNELINKPGELIRIKRNDRLDIIKKCIDWIERQNDLNVFSVVVNKEGRNEEVFELAWNTLLMRFENTLSHNNFKGPQNADDRGLIVCDNTEGEKLRKLLRKMRHYNAIPHDRGFYGSGSRTVKVENIIEDPVFRDSKNSYLHQMNDVLAYCLRQKYEPNSYMRRKGGHNYYNRLENVITKQVTRKNDFGIVEI
jgi:hypothetical protein